MTKCDTVILLYNRISFVHRTTYKHDPPERILGYTNTIWNWLSTRGSAPQNHSAMMAGVDGITYAGTIGRDALHNYFYQRPVLYPILYN